MFCVNKVWKISRVRVKKHLIFLKKYCIIIQEMKYIINLINNYLKINI